MGLFYDTRINNINLAEQVYREPEGFDLAVQTAKNYHLEFPREIRKTNPALYQLSIKIEEIDDDIERLSLWATYLDQLVA